MRMSLARAPHRTLAGLAAGAMMLALLAVATPAQAVESAQRLEGNTRVQTAIAIAEQAYDNVTDVVLATSAVAADSLPGNALAGAVDGALLLTEPDDLNDDVVTALEGLTPDTVHILGGPNAIDPAVETELDGLGYTVNRIGGANRYETSALIAEAISDAGVDIAGGFGGDNTVLVTRGDLPFDAVAASALSFFGPHPIFLTDPSELSTSVEAAMTAVGADKAVILGGTAAVSADVETDVATLTGTDVTRVNGDDRNDTAALLATTLIDANLFDASSVYLTTGAQPYDALTAGQLAGAAGDPSPILLTAGANLSGTSGEPLGFLAANGDDINNLWILGGVQAASADVEADAVGATQSTAYGAALSWVNEVNDSGAYGEGEPGATGSATLSLNPAADTVSYTLDYRDVTGPFDAAPGFHIHEGAIDANGPISLFLATGADLAADDDQVISGTITDDDATDGTDPVDLDALIDAVIANPENYYLNVHSNAFPAGAVRGQLPDGGQEQIPDSAFRITVAPDLVSVQIADADADTVEFTFDEPVATLVAQDGFNLIQTNGDVVDGTVAVISPDDANTVVATMDTDIAADVVDTAARAVVDGNSVADADGNENPLQTLDITGDGSTDGPDLVSVTAEGDVATYTFDEPVTYIVADPVAGGSSGTAGDFKVYGADGIAVQGNSGSPAPGGSATIDITFPAGALDDASVAYVDNQTVENAGGTDNRPDSALIGVATP